MNEQELKAFLLNQYEYTEPPEHLKREVLQRVNILKVAKFLFEHHTIVPLYMLETTIGDTTDATFDEPTDSEEDDEWTGHKS